MSTALLLLTAAALAAPRGVVTDLPEPQDLARTFAPRRVALVVGVNAYQDPLLGDLRFAAKDALDLQSVLADPALGAFDVLSLTERVTRDELWERLAEVTADLQPDDTFLLYLAGHGTMELRPASPEHSFATEPHLYLLTSDSLLDDAGDTGVALTDLDRAVAALPARRRVVVVDACYSGKGRSALSARELIEREQLRGPVPNPALAISRYDVRLFAADVNHPAIEAPELQNGVYSHFLVRGLTGEADLDGDGLVDVREVRLWARDQTMAYTGGAQVPWSHETQVGWGEIYLTGDPNSRQQAEHAILMGLEALPHQAELSVDGQARGAGALEPGEHEVVIHLDGVVIGAGRVRVVAGERLDVMDVVGRGVPADNLRQAGLDPVVYAQDQPLPPVGFKEGLGAGHTWSQDIAPGPAQAQQAQTGELYVQSDPPGAAILLDGVDTGQVTPVLLRELEPGAHALRVEQGCQVAEEEVLVRPRLVARSELELALGVGSLELESIPTGAAVKLDGDPRGDTPLSLAEVACGEHELAFSLAGYAPVVQSLSLPVGQELAINLELEALDYGTLVVIPSPLDAEVVVDGDSVGQGALTLEGVMAGSHEVEVRAVGLPPQFRTVHVPKDNVARLELSLVAPYAGPAGEAIVNPDARARTRALLGRRVLAGVMVAAGAGLAGHGTHSWIQAKDLHDEYMGIETMHQAEDFYDDNVAPLRAVIIVDLSAAGLLLASGTALWIKPVRAWFGREEGE